MRRGHLVILMVEDEEHDITFVQHATEESRAGHTLFAVGSGEEAIRYLRGEGKYADRQAFPMPNVVLTDLKMPGMDGFELLRWMRDHPECRIIPIIVYSNSSAEKDVIEAYRLGANSYMVKPSSLAEMVAMLKIIYDYWSRCECPAKPVSC